MPGTGIKRYIDPGNTNRIPPVGVDNTPLRTLNDQIRKALEARLVSLEHGRYTATLEVPGEPNIHLDHIIIIEGLNVAINGPWVVTRIKHKCGRGATPFTTTLDLEFIGQPQPLDKQQVLNRHGSLYNKLGGAPVNRGVYKSTPLIEEGGYNTDNISTIDLDFIGDSGIGNEG